MAAFLHARIRAPGLSEHSPIQLDHAQLSAIEISPLQIETSLCCTNRQMTFMDTQNSGSPDALESARPYATREDDVCALLSEWRPFATPVFEEQHDALVEYVAESCNIDATRMLWSEIARLTTGAGAKPGKRSILHRRSYVVLDRASPLSEQNVHFDVLCGEHRFIFTSTWRYLCSRSFNLSGTCPFCQVASGGVWRGYPPTTPAMLNADLLDAKGGYRIVLEELTVPARYRAVGYHGYVPTRCVLPHRMSAPAAAQIPCDLRKPHKVGNLRTYLQGKPKSIRCLGPCNSSKRVTAKWISLREAQTRIDDVSSNFQIDAETYQTFSKECMITHASCGHRHVVPPIAFENNPRCDVCDHDPGPVHAWHRVATLQDYDRYLKARCSRELDPEAQVHNEKMFARRFEEGAQKHEIHLRCGNHPEQKVRVCVKWVTRTRGGCCRRSAADSKVKYTAAYLSPLLAKIKIKIDREKSGISEGSAAIPVDQKLHLTCELHGALRRTMTTYTLARYIYKDKSHRYRSGTPCLQCDPNASNRLTVPRIRKYVNSNDRFHTHGGLFELVSTDASIQKQLDAFKGDGYTGSQGPIIRIKAQSDGTPLKVGEVVELSYKKFVRGAVGKPRMNKAASWTSMFCYQLLWNWQIEFECEHRFDGLLTEAGNPARIDFYIPQLKMPFEVDGAQHVSLEHQIGVRTPAEARESLDANQRRDQLVNDYFDEHSEFCFKRLPAYAETSDGIVPLSLRDSYENAFKFCRSIYQRIHSSEPPALNRQRIIDGSITRDLLRRRSSHIDRVYGGFFTLRKLTRAGDNDDEGTERIILECAKGHFIERKSGMVYFHRDRLKHGATVSDFCFCCNAHVKLEALSRLASEAGGEVRDLVSLNSGFTGTEAAPVAKDLLLKDQIAFLRTSQADTGTPLTVTLSIQDALEPGRLFRKLNPRPSKIPPAPYVKPHIVNLEEVEAARGEALAYNRAIKEGRRAKPPVLPKIVLSARPLQADKRFMTLSSRMGSLSDFDLVTQADQIYGPESLVSIKHKACDRESFFRVDELSVGIESGKKIVCKIRTCFEAETGLKLGNGSALPSRKGISPTTKIADLGRLVEEASEGCLTPVREPRDVRAPFVVRVNVGPFKGATFEISSHDNWNRRGTYKRVAMAARGEALWPSRLRWLCGGPG
jgi:hypothetical protein